MSKITIALVDKHSLLSEGLSAMLSTIDDFEVLVNSTSVKGFILESENKVIHVLIRNLYKIENPDIEDINELVKRFPKLKILIISGSENEATIYKIIKAGVKGFLTNDSARQELIEAVYSLRNGYDYFSKCIMNIIVNDYIHKIQHETSPKDSQLEKLSTREIEILKLWGDSHTNKEIADKLFISVRTVESHKTHIMNKLNLKTFVDLLKYSIKNNIIEI